MNKSGTGVGGVCGRGGKGDSGIDVPRARVSLHLWKKKICAFPKNLGECMGTFNLVGRVDDRTFAIFATQQWYLPPKDQKLPSTLSPVVVLETSVNMVPSTSLPSTSIATLFPVVYAGRFDLAMPSDFSISEY